MSLKEKIYNTKPWILRREGDQYEVWNKDTDESGGLYNTKEKAKQVAKKLAGLKDK